MSLYTSVLCRAYTGLVTRGSPLLSFLTTGKCDSRTHAREHTSPLLRILPDSCLNLSTGLGPATSPTSALLPFFLLIYSCFLGPNKHAVTSMLLLPLFSTPDFQWAFPSLISGSCLEVTSTVSLSLTTLHEKVTHILPYPSPTNTAYPPLPICLTP